MGLLTIVLVLHGSIIILMASGTFLRRCVIGKEPQPFYIAFSACVACGMVACSFLGLVAWNSNTPSYGAIAVSSVLLIGFLIGFYHENRSHVWKGLWIWYRNYCLLPSCILALYGTFFCAHFTLNELRNGVDPWLLIERLHSYYVPDHYLQFLLAGNIFSGVPLETHFNPDGNQMWSVGDRPLLLGFLEATFALLFGKLHATSYYLRLMMYSSFLWITLFGLLKSECGVRARWSRLIIIVSIAIQPFFVANVLYTWPKMAGLSFALVAGALLLRLPVIEGLQAKVRMGVVAGAAVSIAILSHTAAVFAVFGMMLLLCLRLYGELPLFALWQRFWRGGWKVALACAAPAIVFGAIHSYVLNQHANVTNLLARVQICRNGSYAHITPVVTLSQACLEYIERQGISGVINDRVESLRRGFLGGYDVFWTIAGMAQAEGQGMKQALSAWFIETRDNPIFSNGVLSLPIFLLIIIVEMGLMLFKRSNLSAGRMPGLQWLARNMKEEAQIVVSRH